MVSESQLLKRDATQLLVRLIAVTAVASLMGYVISSFYPNWRWEQIPFHSLIEGIGGFVAICVAYMLLNSRMLSRGLPCYIWVSSALIGMGMLDMIHAALYPGQQFVWFHSLSNFVGGLLFAMTWLPAFWTRLAIRMQLPLTIFAIIMLLTVIASLAPQTVPDMKSDGSFTSVALLLNVLGGLGFILGALHFMRDAVRDEFQYAPVLANHCLLFGISGVMFEFSSLWDAVWWEWHLLRFIAYGFILYFFYLSYLNERDRYESELHKLSHAVEANGEGVMITDVNGVIEYVNPAFCKISGYSADELVGNNPRMLKSDVQDPLYYKQLWQDISLGKVWSGQLIDRRKDGSFYPAQMVISPITDEQGAITHYVATQSDMTERMKLEEQFRQAQKMESLGTLVGGIAHDFNNMLAAIDGNLFLASRHPDEPEVVKERLNNAQQLSAKAATMVQQLLTYARKDAVLMQQLSFNDVLGSCNMLSSTLVPDNIEYHYHGCDEELTIFGDATQLQQVFINLINNACYAVAQVANPRIECSLASVVADDAMMERFPDLQTRQLARMSVRDNGCGINPANLARIMEPFFTTKPVGEGTGLGLSMVYGSVQRHQGAFEVESRQGEGAMFHIYLPLLEQQPQSSVESVEHYSGESGNGETILLVDDQPELLETNTHILESLNYRVLAAHHGEEALAIYKRNQQQIALVLTDIVMPRMGGNALMEAIWQFDETLPVIFVSGYDKFDDMAAGMQRPHARIISKTSLLTELGQTLQLLLHPNQSDE